MTKHGGGDDRFEAIFRRFYARIWRYFRACRVSDDEAHDLTQDTFKRLFERMGQIRGEDEWPFLQSIARSVFLNWLRARKTAKRSGNPVAIDDPSDEVKLQLKAPEEPDYAERQHEALLRRRLHDAVAALPEGQRQCIQLQLDGFQYTEIAEALRLTMDAVKSRVRDAKRSLRAKLGADTLPEDEE